MAGRHHGLHLGSVAGKHRRQRYLPVVQEPIGLVGGQRVRMREDVLVSTHRSQSLDQLLSRAHLPIVARRASPVGST
jgi:hypothetical protein